MTDVKELVKALREEADWCKAIEWEIPICTEDHILEAADLIEKLVTDIDVVRKERDAAWNTASLLCEGFLDMPSGCDGCPLVDTMIIDEEGNGICSLSRRGIDAE